MSGQIRRQSPGAVWVVVLILVGLFAIDAPPTQATFSLASITNNPNSNQVGYMGMWYAIDQGPVPACSFAGAKPFACAGYPVSPAPSAATSIQASSRVTNANTISTTAVRQQVRVVKCSPTQFANSVGGNVNPLLPRNRVTRQVADPWGTTSASGFAGAQYASSLLTTKPSDQAAGAYTLGVWFKAPPSSTGGGLLSLGPGPMDVAVAGSPVNPAIYLDSSGAPRFTATHAGGQVDVSGGGNYRDDRWHLLVVRKSGGTSNTTVIMYVDGQTVASTSSLPLLQGVTSDYYWKTGWIDPAGLPGATPYFTGSIAGAFVLQGTVTLPVVSAMYSAGSASAYAAALPNKQQLWMMGDPVSSAYDGSVPYVDTTGDPCTYLHLAWQIDGVVVMSGNALSVQETRGWLPPEGAAIKPVNQWSYVDTWIQRAAVYDADVTRMELLTVAEYRFLLSPNWTTTMTFDRMVLLA